MRNYRRRSRDDDGDEMSTTILKRRDEFGFTANSSFEMHGTRTNRLNVQSTVHAYSPELQTLLRSALPAAALHTDRLSVQAVNKPLKCHFAAIAESGHRRPCDPACLHHATTAPPLRPHASSLQTVHTPSTPL
jgi:hypothetical protein